jgi:hypothetical protein
MQGARARNPPFATSPFTAADFAKMANVGSGKRKHRNVKHKHK